MVNNAGGSADLLKKLTKFVDAEQETLDFVIDVNLKGTINCIQSVLKSMINNQYGRIINVASIAGICGIVDRVDYSAAKGGVIALTKALALEVGKYNVCVNAVSPGAIERDGCRLHHMTFIGEDGRTGTPEDVANLVSFLAAQDFITGQNYIIDGGRTLGPKSC